MATPAPITSQRQTAPLIVSAVFAVVSGMAVALRIVSKRLKKTSIDASDYLIFAALICTWALQACDFVGIIIGGVGRHVTEVMETDGPAGVVIFLKDLVAIQILWATSLVFIKLSLLVFYVRIFNVPLFKLVAKVLMVVVLLWGASVVLCAFLLCRPFAFNWDQTIPGGSCGNQILSYIITGAFNILTDFMVLCLPMPMVWNLHVPRKNKIALFGMFGIGFTICIISIVRLITLVSVSYADITYSVVDALIWSMLEPALGVTLACLPLMRPLFSLVFPDTKSKVSANSGSGFSFSQSKDNSKKFRKLDDDEYALRTMADPTGKDSLASNNGSEHRRSPSAGIRVKTEWNVTNKYLTDAELSGEHTAIPKGRD
ncbi:hypothetical protein MMC26_005181 [Xylographa opegraphella]|nr:hypothetical protein [Xylographa opegraphella]